MIVSKRRSIPAVMVGALSLTGVSAFGQQEAAHPPQSQPTQQELLDTVRSLQTKVAQLEAGQQGTAAKVDAALVDRTVTQVLTDAERRSQLMQASGFTAGYTNGKFVIQSEDGNFSLNPNAQLQARYVANFREEGQADGDDDAQDGFEIRRMKFNLDGNIFSKNTKFKIQWATNRTGGSLGLEEAFVQHTFEDTFFDGALSGFGVKFGQFKDFTFHEEITSSKRQLAVERSYLNEIMAGGLTDYEQGITLIYDPKASPFRAEVGYLDGANSDNTNFTDSGSIVAAGIGALHFGVVARAEVKLAGENWKLYDDFTALKNTEDLLVIGGGVNWTEGDNGDVYFHTVDAQWEPVAVPGLSVYAAAIGLYAEYGDGDDDAYHYGGLVQAGYLLDSQWEVFGRYDISLLDDGAPTGTGTLGSAADIEDTIHEITVGVNYYVKGHASKITLDVTWLPNGAPLAVDGAGILANTDGDQQFTVRAQYQLLL